MSRFGDMVLDAFVQADRFINKDQWSQRSWAENVGKTRETEILLFPNGFWKSKLPVWATAEYV